MSSGIATTSMVPVREKPLERSGLVTQVLFGEVFDVEESEAEWCRIRALDGSEGWVERTLVRWVDEGYLRRYRECARVVVSGVFGLVRKEGDWAGQMVAAGSVLPCYERESGKFQIGDDIYLLEGGLEDRMTSGLWEIVVRGAFLYYNTPYLWGGRSPQGIDDAGLVQMAYRQAGVDLPRNIEGMLRQGRSLSFLEEARSGDVAFFGDQSGELTHVGIVWGTGRLIHASGRVRVDKLDHNGVFSEEMKRYTHSLKLLKRYFL